MIVLRALRVELAAANTHDSQHGTRIPRGEIKAPPPSGRQDVRHPHLRKWLWGKHIGVSIARKGIDSSERLDQHVWVIDRTESWLNGYRRPNHRYERKPGNYLAFLGLAAALCCSN
ncbi:hypothetical protein YW3DRAFT_07295 [Streptomyces sp. MnatMP-M77]|nr:hypothetical protein [Streptomyces sp. SID8364]SBV06001.1 hypothetical protein YW3DRAFT_07295 [Streptomyces sp. MnatMP-M77]